MSNTSTSRGDIYANILILYRYVLLQYSVLHACFCHISLVAFAADAVSSRNSQPEFLPTPIKNKQIWHCCADINCAPWRKSIEQLQKVLSTCPLHTNSGCGKERRILIGPWWPAKAALVPNYLEVYWPCAGGLSAVNAIGTQLRDPINSGLTRCRMAVMNE